MQFQIEIYSRETGTLRLQVLHKRVKDGINENLSFFPLQFKIEVVYAVDPKIMLDPILLGWKKTENELVSKCSKSTGNNAKHGLRKGSTGNGLLSIVWEDVVGKDELRRNLTDHPKHRVVLLIFMGVLLPQHLLKLNLVEALGVLGCMDLG
jgi:hypothetical protein